MNAAPTECRILTALLLAPMAARELATALFIDKRDAHHRIEYLLAAGDVCVHSNTFGRRPAARYQLTTKGRQWAMELIA